MPLPIGSSFFAFRENLKWQKRFLFEAPETEADMPVATGRASVNTDAVVKLYITFQNKRTYQGSAFLYGTNALATVGHCIYDPRYGSKATSIRAVFSDGIGVVKSYDPWGVGFKAGFVGGQSGGPVILGGTDTFIAIANYHATPPNYPYPTGARITNTVADFLDLYY